MGYEMVGTMQEVCSCASICPCWVGLDPDGGTCGFAWVFHVDRGTVEGVDVGGVNMGFVGDLPGNVLKGNVRLLVLVDERSSEEQEKALLGAFTGQFGGPLKDLAGLVGEVVGVERTQIEFDGESGTGTFRAGSRFSGSVSGYRSPSGEPTAMTGALLGPVLGSPGYPGKVESFRVDDEHGLAFTHGGSMQTRFHYATA